MVSGFSVILGPLGATEPQQVGADLPFMVRGLSLGRLSWGGSLAVVPNAEMGDGFPGAWGAEEGSAWFSGQSGLCGRWAGLGREGVCFSPANLVVV